MQSDERVRSRSHSGVDRSDLELQNYTDRQALQTQLKARRPSRGGLLPRDNECTIVLDEEAIFQVTQYHVEFKLMNTTLRELKQYNDPTPYDVSVEAQNFYLKQEIERLVKAAKHVGPFNFHVERRSGFSTKLDDAFEELSKVADQIKVAMNIVRLDNAAISIQFCEHSIKKTIEDYKLAMRVLRGRYNADNEQGHVVDSAPKVLEHRVRNHSLFNAIVDYMTATLARTLVRTATGTYRSEQMLSSLASCTFKLKILARDLKGFAEQSIVEATNAIDYISNQQKQTKDEILPVKVRGDDKKWTSSDVDPSNTETDASCRYHEEKTFYNRRIWLLLGQMLYNLLVPDLEKARPECFQIYNALYHTGIDGPPTIVSCDRQGEIAATSDRFDIAALYTTLMLVETNVKDLESRVRLSSNPRFDISGTRVKYEWSTAESKNRDTESKFWVSNVDDVLSVMAPLSLCGAHAAVYIAQLVSFAASCTNEDYPIQLFEGPPKDFHASFEISTFAWRKKERSLPRDDVVILATSPLQRRIQPNTNLQRMYQDQEDGEQSAKQRKADVDTHRAARDKISKQRWVVAEDSIRISCRAYVYTACVLAGIVLCGSVAIPFTVRDRLPGVDPFNITLFSWLVSGLILIIAKGRYVNEWPWHQFIHGHVVCRSLEEVCEVSRVDAQTVLSYLLLNESKSILRTRGPYNGLFGRRSDDPEASFSINRPIHITTIMASGFIALKVLNMTGEHLVFLDARKGRDFVGRMRRTDPHIACVDLEQYEDSRPAQGDAADSLSRLAEDYDTDSKRHSYENLKGVNRQVRRLELVDLWVDRILGVYIGDNLSFFG